jgi:hypothetical protein
MDREESRAHEYFYWFEDNPADARHFLQVKKSEVGSLLRLPSLFPMLMICLLVFIIIPRLKSSIDFLMTS